MIFLYELRAPCVHLSIETTSFLYIHAQQRILGLLSDYPKAISHLYGRVRSKFGEPEIVTN